MLICFDLGGVVVRTCHAWRLGCEVAGVPYREEIERPDLRDRFGRVVHAYETDAISWEEYLERGAQALGGLYRPDELARIHESWLQGEYEGLATLVREIHDRGEPLTTGCLSNTNRRHWEIMEGDAERFPAFHQLRHRHASFQLGAMKPDAAIFRLAEEKTGRRGDGVLFFDDVEENVAGARQWGWRAERIDRTGDVAAQVRLHLQAHGVPGF